MRIVGARGRRSLAAFVASSMALLLAAQTAFAAVDWGKVREVSPGYTYNFGGSLARSTKGTTSYLHATYTAVKVGGDFIDDNGPFAGVYYRRGNSSGSDWGTAKRLNPSGSHADLGAVVASGRAVYAAYVSVGHWIDYDPSEPRPITVRINENHGAASAWLSRKVTFANRVDRPAMAPWGTRGFLLVYTDADSGDIILVSCGDLTIEESGCTGGVVGTTTEGESTEDGFAGMPVVAAAGETVAVAWFDGSGGIVVSTREGDGDFSAPVELASGPANGLSAAAKGDRFAFSWAENDGVRARIWTSAGGLGATRTVASFSDTSTYKAAYSTAVGLAGSDTIGVAFGACRQGSCTASSSTGVDMRWRQSGNDGASWGSASTVASYSASSERRINDFPSVLMTSTTKRYVMFNIANASISKFRVLLRVGKG